MSNEESSKNSPSVAPPAAVGSPAMSAASVAPKGRDAAGERRIRQVRRFQAWLKPAFREPVAAANFVLAVIAIFGFPILLYQTYLTRESIVQTRHAFEVAHRARIDVSQISKFELSPDAPDPSLTLKNFGSLPASAVQVIIDKSASKSAPDQGAADQLKTEQELSYMAVPPGHTIEIPLRFEGLTEDVVSSIQGRTYRLYLLGRVVYDDGFQSRRTTFCAYLDIVDGTWTFCSNNNIRE